MYVFEIKSNSEYSLHTCIFIIIRSSVIKKKITLFKQMLVMWNALYQLPVIFIVAITIVLMCFPLPFVVFSLHPLLLEYLWYYPFFLLLTDYFVTFHFNIVLLIKNFLCINNLFTTSVLNKLV